MAEGGRGRLDRTTRENQFGKTEKDDHYTASKAMEEQYSVDLTIRESEGEGRHSWRQWTGWGYVCELII